ncbi:tRNA(Ile)-lysidine synthase TilS [Paenibacillus sp. NAIST15-1]|nr:tRNA(Ile)-lysidine synthase TilS [Paenibacillus sp. NAIST15-1]
MRVQGLNGSKKVQDMFVDLKIAPSLRDTIPLVADANGHIVWIPGVRRSNAAYVQPSTQAVVHFALEGGAHERSVHP